MIIQRICEALESVGACEFPGEGRGELHRRRSEAFVEKLAELLRREFACDESIRVLSRGYSGNKAEFGLNELLFDITVCRVDRTTSARGGQMLTVVTKGLWAIESEFARDSRQAVFDFNKLVLGSAANKVFVGPLVSDQRAFLQALELAAGHCSGRVFFVAVPHPACWSESVPKDVKGWEWAEGRWHEPLEG